ncbi:P-loop containing nucleoside triphosphate hydrolase protein [Chlamydoabsidia padenii]|nr:P-loop containing nucleoside triphosphate hydrolase protein [Chlamydoabsidia padenii]
MTSPHYLSQLSELQTKAVTSSAKHLQILAGPGSGKTKALTTRVTWLIKENNMDPSSILVVTFTNKAANEMKERLERPSMVGREQSRLLSMGTFHSLCARMLRLHVDLTLLKPNFVITDANKSIQLVKMVLKELQPTLSSSTQKKSQDIFYDNISKAKNQGLDHITYMARFENDPVKKDIALVYRAYEEKLETGNMIDFDGLLLHGRNLLKDYPEVVDHIEHVLVDEFQDTNELQYELIRLLTHRGDKSLTVVGDPDQSIFGWRFANKSHFGKMVSDYKDTIVVNLEESYRSTKNIIACATHVVNKDTKRESRNLYTSNPDGSLVSVLKVNSEKHETELVAKEIKRIVEFSNGLINYKDIAILFRMNFMTLNFERALSRANIPHIVVSGSRFLDLMEVKDVLAYLHLFYNHRDLASFTRIINTPKRGLGEISIKKIQVMAATQDWTLLETMHNIVDQHPSTCSMRIMSKAKLEMANLLTLQKKVQDMMNEKVQTDNILKCIVDSIGYRDYLQTNYAADYETKWANVDELFTFAKRQDSQSYQGER